MLTFRQGKKCSLCPHFSNQKLIYKKCLKGRKTKNRGITQDHNYNRQVSQINHLQILKANSNLKNQLHNKELSRLQKEFFPTLSQTLQLASFKSQILKQIKRIKDKHIQINNKKHQACTLGGAEPKNLKRILEILMMHELIIYYYLHINPMIDSGMYTRSAMVVTGQVQSQEIDLDIPSTTVNKSTMYHLVSSHINQIFQDEKIQSSLKQKFVYDFGFKLGQNIAEQQCLGYVKYCIPKADNKKQKKDDKQFVGEMKILNGRIWSILVGNKGKLYAINNQNIKGVFYKIEDKQFTLGKSTRKPIDSRQKEYRKLLIQYCQGFVKGSLEKFNLSGQIICAQGAEGSVFAQLKNLQRKTLLNSYSQYSKAIAKDNNF